MNVASRAGLALAACVMSAGPAWGQGMVPYFNDSRTEPYMERTGGSRIAFSSTDDGSGQVMLPFSFRFYGQTHNRVWVSTNGFITFSSASATSLGNTNFPSSGNPNGVIAGLWDDLLGPTGTYHLEGTSPSRVMIIQIKNITGFGGSRNGTANFQYRLYEGMSGRFEIHYGPMTTSGTGWTASIGYENQAGNRGHAFQSCTSSCNSAQINMLANRVFRAQQDAGMDVFAAGIEAPERVFAGVPFDVMTTLVSQHMNNLGPFNYAVHLLGPGQTGPVNSVWTSGTVTLTPYQTRMATDSISIPLSTPRGRYRLALQADPGNMLMEPDESNNFVIGMRDIEVAERQPDYTISRVAVSNTSVRPGDIVDVNVDLANAGNLTGGTEWQIVLSTNQVISRDDRVVHTSSTTLAPLTTVTTTTSITLPSDLAPGSRGGYA